jgi:hypothetical protein
MIITFEELHWHVEQELWRNTISLQCFVPWEFCTTPKLKMAQDKIY